MKMGMDMRPKPMVLIIRVSSKMELNMAKAPTSTNN